MENQRRNPAFTLIALAISAFAIGSTEFICVGLLPLIANDMGISVSSAGLTVSMYALGVTIGAPLLTVLSAKMNRKRLMLAIMLVFIIGNLLVASAPNFTIILTGRIVSALAHGIFMSVAAIIAADVVHPDKRASAIAIMFTGLTVATISGVPLGTYIGQISHWRVSFIFIAFIGLIGLLANLFLVPKDLPTGNKTTFSRIPKVLFHKKILPTFLITALGYGGTFVVYTYISPILEDQMGFSAGNVVWILIGYGVMVAIGNTLGGKFANNKPLKALMMMFLLLALSLLTIYFTMNFHWLGLISVMLMGLFAFMNVPGLQLYVVVLAERYLPNDIGIASALNISAFNIGITLGAVIGGRVTEQFSLGMTPLFGFGMVMLAVGVTYWLSLKSNSSSI